MSALAGSASVGVGLGRITSGMGWAWVAAPEPTACPTSRPRPQPASLASGTCPNPRRPAPAPTMAVPPLLLPPPARKPAASVAIWLLATRHPHAVPPPPSHLHSRHCPCSSLPASAAGLSIIPPLSAQSAVASSAGSGGRPDAWGDPWLPLARRPCCNTSATWWVGR